MNPHPQYLHRLLHDVVPDTGSELGPDRHELLAMVQREGSRRHRARVIFTSAAMVAVTVLVLFRPVSREAPAPVAKVVEPPSIVIHEVDDQQLLALMQDTPVALMEWPNGERTLLVLVP